MLKVNLERELIKQNKSVVTAKELLLLKEYDTVGDGGNDNALRRVFGEVPALEGKSLKIKIGHLAAQTLKYEQGRVFHISQIEKLCKKYHLRFLRTGWYCGNVDSETSSKISQFEIAYNVACDGDKWEGNTFIAAPKSAFKLERKPKDPLLFYKINEQYYYLIHKWGNDLSLIRRVYGLLGSRILSNLLIWGSLAVAYFWLGKYATSVGNDLNWAAALQIPIFMIGSVGFMLNICCGFKFRFAKTDNWDLHYLD